MMSARCLKRGLTTEQSSSSPALCRQTARPLARAPVAARRCLQQRGYGQEGLSAASFPLGLSVPTTGMARLGSSGGATLQRSKLDMKQEVKQTSPQLDNAGGSGGMGKGIFNGGGGDEGDDKDDYFSNFGDDGEDLGKTGLLRKPLEELYDPASINAVLTEWFRTIEAIPLMIRQSVAMGFFSSAQLVRFLSLDQRPSIARALTRTLPPQASRGAVGRMMADPAFAQKFVIEVGIASLANLVWEVQQRGDQFFKELDLVAINTLAMAAVTGALVWQVSPNRAHGMGHKHQWQNMLANLPNNVFDASTPRHHLSLQTRLGGMLAKTAELCALGSLAGGAMTGLGQASVAMRRQLGDREFQPSVPIPSWWQNTAGMAAYMGVSANVRYQLVSGIDRFLFDRLNVLPLYLGFSTVLRTLSTVVGQPTRLHFQGLSLDAVAAHQQALPARSSSSSTAEGKQRKKVVVRKRVVKRAAAGAASGVAGREEGLESAGGSTLALA